MGQRGRIEIGNLQRAILVRPVGISSDLNYAERCAVLNHERMWLQQANVIFVLLSSIITHDSCNSATQFRNQTRYF